MDNNHEGKIQHELQLRAKVAEKPGNTAKGSGKPSPQHYDTLLHELRIHQIELEMQNEELRRMQVALETSHAHYVDLYEFAPVGYLTLTAEGIIAEINLTAAKLLGVERKNLINRRFAQFIEDEYKDLWYRHFMQAKQSDGKHGCELPFHHENGTILYLHLDCLFIGADDASSLLRITLTDVTERKQTEVALRIAAAAFETQEGIIVADANKCILRVNQAFSRITGYSAEETIGRNAAFLHSNRHDEGFCQALWHAVSSAGYWQGEIWEKRKNGDLLPLWLTLTAVTGADGAITHYVGSIMDITVQKQAEKVLHDARQRMENQVASTQEELEKIKAETAEVNTAFNVILKHMDQDISEAQIALTCELETTVLPLLKKLKGANTGRLHSIRLIGILESNLRHLVKTYGLSANLPAAYHKLTPLEKQVASMVRQGLSTKIIAATLNVSPGTVSIHRKHIRKKLGVGGKVTNLCNYLASLTE
jgi:PAS domain S-box-containing protein